MEAFRKYINVDSNSVEGNTLLATDFIIDDASDIRRRLQKLELLLLLWLMKPLKCLIIETGTAGKPG